MNFKEVTIRVRFKDTGSPAKNNSFLRELYDGATGAILDAAKARDVSVFNISRERTRWFEWPTSSP